MRSFCFSSMYLLPSTQWTIKYCYRECQGTAFKWFQSYWSNRQQFVSIDEVHSSTKPLNCGVPQGSVLIPLLYLLYTDPISEIMKFHNMNYHMYADDTQLYFSQFKSTNPDDSCDPKSKVEACVSDIISWMTVNHLKINSEKTEFLICSLHFSKSSQT